MIIGFYNMQNINFFSFIIVFSLFFFPSFVLEAFMLEEKTIQICHYREQRDQRQLDCTCLCNYFCYF